MKKLKLMTVVGTRPEIIRLSRVIVAADRHFEHTLVHTGQNFDYELNQVFFEDLGLRPPDVFLDCAVDSPSAAATIANVIVAVDRVLSTHQPDALLLLGDTNSCLSAISAKRRKVPVFHMEAGNRCFDQRVPEETNRRIVDHIADVNLTYSAIAREYLLREGLPPDQVIKVGSPMFEVLEHSSSAIQKSDVLSRLSLQSERYFVVSAHREENIDSTRAFGRLVAVLNAIAEDFKLPVVVSAHPRTRKKIEQEQPLLREEVRLLRPLGFHDYVHLQLHAKTVLSDSGTINEESSILNFPALNLRESHERPEAMEEAAVMMVGLDVDSVRQALSIVGSQPRAENRILRMVPDYSVPNVSEKVVRIIQSYVGYVNRVVWKKYD